MLDARRMGGAMLGGGRTILQHPGMLIAGLSIAMPWLSWIHLTSASHSVAALHTPQWLWIMGTMAAIGLLIARQDGWLGALVIYTACRAVTADYLGTFEVAYVVTLGAVCVWLLQQVPRPMHQWMVAGLVASGCLEVVYLIQQALGFDLLWGHWHYAPGWLFGTMGNPSYVGVYLGMLVPLAPWWIVPWLMTGISLTQSMTGAVAGMTGLFVRYRLYTQRAWRLCALLLVTMGIGWYQWHGISTMMVRLTVWTYAIWHLIDTPTHALLGFGLGGWYPLEGNLSSGTGEMFFQAHNEYMQWAYEGGVCGVMAVLGWLYRHRMAFLSKPYGGAMTAVALAAAMLFIFHLTILALTAICILGMGTRHEEGVST